MGKDKSPANINIKNKKAYFEFSFIDTYVAGMQLKGTEIKSIRAGKVNLNEGYCYFQNGELMLKNVHIATYEKGTHFNHEPLRERKLLLKKKEIEKLEYDSKDKGLTIIPLRLFVNERGFAKIEIALAKGKKLFDKREDIKAKDVKRELDKIKY